MDLMPEVVIGGSIEDARAKVAGPGGVLHIPEEIAGDVDEDEFMAKLVEAFAQPVRSSLPPPRWRIVHGEGLAPRWFDVISPDGKLMAMTPWSRVPDVIDEIHRYPYGRVTTF